MFRSTLAHARSALYLFATLTLVTGMAYPVVVTLVAQLTFSREAGGSFVWKDGKFVGSDLLAQPFTSPRYFWPRPSASDYNGANSVGSNLGPTNPALTKAVEARVAALRADDPGYVAPIPVDLVTASGSGLDPDISPAAAMWQAPRIARERGTPLQRVEQLIREHTTPRTFGLLGEPRINVLQLNLALDQLDRGGLRESR